MNMLPRWLPWVILAALPFLAGCAQQTAPAAQLGSPVAAVPPMPSAPVQFDEAVLSAGNAVLTAAAATTDIPQTLVIDPLVNGVTGEQSHSTREIGSRLVNLIHQSYPKLQVEPFTASTVNTARYVMIGTFTPVNAVNQFAGTREAYRFCLVIADLKSGKIIAKRVVRSTPDGIDGTPTRFFVDSPAWTNDPGMKSYIDACQMTKVGDPIPPAYLNGLLTAAMISQAIDEYDAGHYGQALDLYKTARMTPAGDQLRIYNGLYLVYSRLDQRAQAVAAFGDIVDDGLRNNRLAVKLLFRPSSTAFVTQPQTGGGYDMWLQQIADHSASAKACLLVTGHTSASGSAILNQRLSVLRAEYVKGRLESDSAALRSHIIADGKGADETLVGTGADSGSDALDRRVEFKVIQTC
jgi:hypothetical protein